ncbi:transporter [Paramyrothecium foliicola]|nr:transporter [Paramyrothecium foliicola]
MLLMPRWSYDFWYDNNGSVDCDLLPDLYGCSLQDFFRWDPSLKGSCASFPTDFSYCVEGPLAPTSYSTKPPVSSTTSKESLSSTIKSSSATSKASSTSSASSNGIETPLPVQPGMVDNCDEFYFVKSGEGCANIVKKHGITLSQFTTWNPGVGSDCTGLWGNAYACVSIIGHTPSPTTPPNGIETPQPIQDGMTTNCNKFHLIKSGNSCSAIQSTDKISFTDLYKWNPAIGSGCGSLWLNSYVCVGVIGGTPTNPPDDGIETPQPIQDGMVNNCKKFHFVKPTQTCQMIQDQYKVTLANLVKWNPAIGSGCNNLWANTNLCVGVSAVASTSSTGYVRVASNPSNSNRTSEDYELPEIDPTSEDTPRVTHKMSYRPLVQDDSDGRKNSYGSTASSSTVSEGSISLLQEESAYQDFEKRNKNPFVEEETIEYWRKVYDDAQYECRHVFDPSLTWTQGEERNVIWKLDMKVCLWACVMFFGLQVDRNNLQQAVSDNLLEDLGLDTDDFNYGNTVFLISFLFAELPSQLISKRLGPDRWVPTQMIIWSLVAISQCALTGRTTFLLTRCLLGLLEGGFIPDLVLWLSYFYTSRELPIRLSYFWTTLSVTGIITALLAYPLLHMRGVWGIEGWRWLFLVEGMITLIIGVMSFFMMPASAVQTKTWFRPHGWFTEREEAIVVNRVLRDDPSKGDMHNREALTPKKLWEAVKDFDLWPLYIIGFVAYIPQGPPHTYITLTLRSLGFSTFATNLLTIPYHIAHIIQLLALTALSERLNQRALTAIFQPLWTLPCIIALRYWPGVFVDKWGTYTLVMVLLSYPYCHAILVGWCSTNSNNVGSRTVSTALYNMAVQAGSVYSAHVYRESDKPLYHRGNSALLWVNILTIVVFLGSKFYYIWRNKQKARVWKAMTPEQQVEYRKTTQLQGSRRLDFKFVH